MLSVGSDSVIPSIHTFELNLGIKKIINFIFTMPKMLFMTHPDIDHNLLTVDIFSNTRQQKLRKHIYSQYIVINTLSLTSSLTSSIPDNTTESTSNDGDILIQKCVDFNHNIFMTILFYLRIYVSAVGLSRYTAVSLNALY